MRSQVKGAAQEDTARDNFPEKAIQARAITGWTVKFRISRHSNHVTRPEEKPLWSDAFTTVPLGDRRKHPSGNEAIQPRSG